jgi:PhnB protein
MEPTRTPRLAPYIVAKDARGLARFLEQGLGGTISFEANAPDGSLNHVEVRIADSVVMLGEASSGSATFPAMIHLYVPDADAAYDRALKAGATSIRAPALQGDGDRRGGVKDAWGNQWWFGTPSRGL